jgi:hypothetical protein
MSLQEISTGWNSNVYRLPNNIILKLMGLQKPIETFDMANMLLQNIIKYREILSNLGIPLSQFVKYEISPFNEKFCIKMYETDSGDNLLDILYSLINKTSARAQKKVTNILQQVTNSLVNVSQHTSQNGLLLVSIDPILKNYTLKKDKVYYIDFMPPRFFDADDDFYWVEYPQIDKHQRPEDYEMWVERYFTVEGLWATFFSQLGRAFPNQYHKFRTIVLQEVKNKNYVLYQRLHHLFNSIRFEGVVPNNPLFLRLMFIENLYCKQQIANQAEMIEEFFQWSHHERGLTSQEVQFFKTFFRTNLGW